MEGREGFRVGGTRFQGWRTRGFRVSCEWSTLRYFLAAEPEPGTTRARIDFPKWWVNRSREGRDGKGVG